MSVNAGPFASHRGRLLAGAREALAGLGAGHAALLRDQIATADGRAGEQEAFLPSLLCLAAAEALGAPAERALPAATALLCLAEMASIFEGIAGHGTAAGALPATWGMPRALNAGDGFFVVAQSALLKAEGLSAEERLRALDLLDGACRDLSEELYEAAQANATVRGRSLLPAAAALGGLFAAADAGLVACLTAFGSFHALTVDAGRTRLRIATGLLARLSDQHRIDRFPQPAARPAPKVAIHGLPRRQIGGQHAPLAAGPGDVQNGVDDEPYLPLARSAPLAGRKVLFNLLPFGILQIGRVGLREICHSTSLPDR